MRSVASLWRRAPRRLKVTRAGAMVLGVALALGLAAINTGNNPLFFLWGVMLGGVVVSGVLSEATLRPLWAEVELTAGMRAGEGSQLALRLSNRSRLLPALAVTWSVTLRDSQGDSAPQAAYVLRLGAGERLRLWLPVQPRARGLLEVAAVAASTAYPFGLFVKERPFHLAVRPAMVRPPKREARHLMAQVRAQAQGAGGQRALQGDDFRMLRPQRQGDPWRRVLWRRVASTGRSLVVEHEGERAESLVLEVKLPPPGAGPVLPAQAAAEQLLALAGSLAEGLLADGLAVGLWTHGAALAAATGAEQAAAILDALARVDAAMPLPERAPTGGPAVTLAALLAEASVQAAFGRAAPPARAPPRPEGPR